MMLSLNWSYLITMTPNIFRKTILCYINIHAIYSEFRKEHLNFKLQVLMKVSIKRRPEFTTKIKWAASSQGSVVILMKMIKYIRYIIIRLHLIFFSLFVIMKYNVTDKFSAFVCDSLFVIKRTTNQEREGLFLKFMNYLMQNRFSCKI